MLTIKRRRTFRFDATYYSNYVAEGDPSNVVQNLTGWSVRSQIREKRTTGKKDGKVIANLNVTIPVPLSGQIRIAHDRTFTRSLRNRTPDEIEWDIVGTDPTGRDYDLVPTEPAQIITPPTDPEDNSSDDFIPGGGGAIYHTHPISQVIGLQQALDDLAIWETGVTSALIDASDNLVIVKNGNSFYVPLIAGTP